MHKNYKASAMIISMVIVTLITSVVIGSSRIFLDESISNTRFVDGIQAWYAAKSGETMINSNGNYEYKSNLKINHGDTKTTLASTFATKSERNMDSVTLMPGEPVSFMVNKPGQAKFYLRAVNVDGKNCPDGGSVYAYLDYKVLGNNGTLNLRSQMRGVWPDVANDNTVSLSTPGQKLVIVLKLSEQVVINGVYSDKSIKKCVVTTSWKIDAPSGALSQLDGYEKSIGQYGDVVKVLYR